ncbi:MAG: putative 26S proteasome non-ATPase regulatory subunit 6, partial [Streblomastix strix]
KISSSAATAAGIDWERRNRLTIFRAVYNLQSRNFIEASKLLQESISTFQTPELFGEEKLVLYTVCTSLIAIDSRSELNNKCVRQPDVISSINQTPHLHDLLHSFYKGEYSAFILHLGLITEEVLQQDKILGQHATYFCKEMRAKAYNQYITPYRSVGFSQMAREFGVSLEFLEIDLERFITAGKVHARIDKVTKRNIIGNEGESLGGVVETRRVETKGVKLDAVLTGADKLISKMQKIVGSVIHL